MPVFDVKRATDAAYLAEFAADFVRTHNDNKDDETPELVLRTQKNDEGVPMFAIVVMMYIFGSYVNRKSALSTWRNLKYAFTHQEDVTYIPESSQLLERDDEFADQESGSVTAGSSVFWKNINKSDYCTLGDFLDHILDHLTGHVAETIQFARRKTSTLVSTGSDMAVALTEQNARALAEAPKEVRDIVNTLKDQTERAAAKKGIAPTVTRRTVKDRFDKVHYLYVRGYCPELAERRIAKNKPAATDVPTLSYVIVKFGIATDIDLRHEKYGWDDGWFFFCIDFMSKDEAEHIEDVLKVMFKPFRLEGRREYLFTEKLCPFLKVPVPVTEEGYRLMMLRLFTLAIRLAHSFYPDMVNKPFPYGRKFDPVEAPSVAAQLCGAEENGSSSASAVTMTQVNVKETVLTLDMLPDYETLFPGLLTPPLPEFSVISLQIEQEKTKQAEAGRAHSRAEVEKKALALVETGKMTFEQMMQFFGKTAAEPTSNVSEAAEQPSTRSTAEVESPVPHEQPGISQTPIQSESEGEEDSEIEDAGPTPARAGMSQFASTHPTSKKVHQYSIDGKYMASYGSVSNASKRFGFQTKALRMAMQLERPLIGCFWRYGTGRGTEDIPARRVEECHVSTHKVLRTWSCLSEAARVLNITTDALHSLIMLGGTSNDDHRYKYSDANLIIASPNGRTGRHKRVEKRSMDGRLVQVFNCLTKAYKDAGLGKTTMSQRINAGTPVNGFLYKYSTG